LGPPRVLAVCLPHATAAGNLNGSAPTDGDRKISVADAFKDFQKALLAGMPNVKDNRERYNQAWCAAAANATRSLLDLTASWGRAVPPEREPTGDVDCPVDFVSGTAPKPEHVMRITPNV
jgi:hypothetical protein